MWDGMRMPRASMYVEGPRSEPAGTPFLVKQGRGLAGRLRRSRL